MCHVMMGNLVMFRKDSVLNILSKFTVVFKLLWFSIWHHKFLFELYGYTKQTKCQITKLMGAWDKSASQINKNTPQIQDKGVKNAFA